jgi:signal peptidase II
MIRPLLIAAVILLLDQASKLFLLFVYNLPVREPLVMAPFLEFITVWNSGISYGLFQQHDEVGRWILVGVTCAATTGLTVWMLRTSHRFLAFSLALIVGGAVGNLIDRISYGAVFDFVHLHFGTFSWYVFNVADAAIVAGVIGLLYETFIKEPRRHAAVHGK